MIQEKCMFEGCDKDIYGGGRGLCRSHLVVRAYHVRKGHTTWAQLEEEGKCRRPLTQDEKNINQMHPHKSYRRKEE